MSIHFFLLWQTKLPGVKSIISKASNSKADRLIEAGEKIHFGDLFLEVWLTPWFFFLCLSSLHCVTWKLEGFNGF